MYVTVAALHGGGGDGGGSVADNELDTDGSENDRDRDRDPDFYPTTASRPHLQLKKTKGPTLLSSRRLAKLLAPLDARSTCEEDGEEDMDIDGSNNSDGQEETDPPYQGLQAMSLAATEVDSTQSYAIFIKKLSIFALERFCATINCSIVRLEKERPTFISTSMSASRTMYQVLHHSGKPAQFSADYGPHLATLWTAVNYQRERFTFHEVQIAMLKSEHMLAITAAWTWLDVDIPSMLYWLLQYPEKAKEQTAWLKSLLKDVQAQLLLPQERRQPLQLSKYLVPQENKEYTIKYNNHLPLQRNGSSMHDLLVKFAREALLLWLKFPSGQVLPAHVRGSDHFMEALQAAADKLAWLEMFKSKEPGWCMPYIEAYRFTQRVQRGHKILPQLSPLTGMLIAADLVYAGKVAMPSAEEMGEMVYLLDRGASACLRFFRLLDRLSDKESVIFVFTSLYNKVYSSFTEAERSTMTFDPIIFEHTLCKYQRCVEL
ncbi:hypothetical protein C8Q79DRAFT_1015263 [Trametes meyenii]|nr:hypothetical protein C8Q79DRAFT_1015263 [Trametes meyenii]